MRTRASHGLARYTFKSEAGDKRAWQSLKNTLSSRSSKYHRPRLLKCPARPRRTHPCAEKPKRRSESNGRAAKRRSCTCESNGHQTQADTYVLSSANLLCLVSQPSLWRKSQRSSLTSPSMNHFAHPMAINSRVSNGGCECAGFSAGSEQKVRRPSALPAKTRAVQERNCLLADYHRR